MTLLYNLFKLKCRRLELRRNQTTQETILWHKIRNRQLGHKFKRQYSIGGYVADFYCPIKRLVIEIDGSQHFEKDNLEYDRMRTNYFNTVNIEVLRLSNAEVNTNIEGVLLKIKTVADGLPLDKGELPKAEEV